MALAEGPYRALLVVLEESKRRGFLGPGPVETHVARALDGSDLVANGPSRALDLGSGGGIPGLPLALIRPEMHWVLLDGSETRATFLREAVGALGLGERVEVVAARAEVAAHQDGLRGTFGLVVARSFGPPAVTAECAAPFLLVGGHLIVAEPPGGDDRRWPADDLRKLGLKPVRTIVEPSAFQVLQQIETCPDRYPRRVGVPAKRPLF
jgi:16S rRNA (guanine527-N7)-methyltransferase